MWLTELLIIYFRVAKNIAVQLFKCFLTRVIYFEFCAK